MGIARFGDHTVYTGGDCPPGFVIVGDAIVPKATYRRMKKEITPEEEKKELEKLRNFD